jgi:hypothetical protein
LPKAQNDASSVPVNTTDTISVLNNDSDLENDQLFVNFKTTPQHGTAVVNADNTVTYTPDNGFTGIDTFRYMTCEYSNPSCRNCATALVTIQVGVNAISEVAAGGIKIYPNPTNKLLKIASSSSEQVLFRLFNLEGQELRKGNFKQSATIDVSGISAGAYFVSVYDLQGREVVKQRVEVVH